MGLSLKRTGVTADHLTLLGGLISVGAAVAIGAGWLGVGFALLVLTAVPDVLDGAVAKASGTASPRGSFFDSVMDRIADAFLLGGVAWYLAASRGGYWPMLALAVLAASMLVSYERAKAESLGFEARGGLMERAERLVLLSVGLIFEVLLIPVLFLMLVLTVATAVQRFFKVWKQASAGRPAVVQRQERRARRRAARSAARAARPTPWSRRLGGR